MEQEIRTAVEMDSVISGLATQLAPIWIAIAVGYFGFLALSIGLRKARLAGQPEGSEYMTMREIRERRANGETVITGQRRKDGRWEAYRE